MGPDRYARRYTVSLLSKRTENGRWIHYGLFSECCVKARVLELSSGLIVLPCGQWKHLQASRAIQPNAKPFRNPCWRGGHGGTVLRGWVSALCWAGAIRLQVSWAWYLFCTYLSRTAVSEQSGLVFPPGCGVAPPRFKQQKPLFRAHQRWEGKTGG